MYETKKMVFFKKRALLFGKRIFTSRIIIFLVLITLLLLKFFYPTSSRISWNKKDAQSRLEELVDKESVSINDSLPHYQFKRKQDSILAEVSADNFPAGSGMKIFNLGIYDLITKKGERKYYLIVGGYFAKNFFSFYSLHETNFIEYEIPTKTNDAEVQSIETRTIKTNLKLEQLNEREWQIGYPVSRIGYNIGRVVIVVLMIIFFALFFFGIIGMPLKLLFLIAKGKAFSGEAIERFHTIAAILLISGIFLAIIMLALHLFYKAQMPYPVSFYFFDDIMSGWGLVVWGLIVLLFAKAFQHGYELQQEQELTV